MITLAALLSAALLPQDLVLRGGRVWTGTDAAWTGDLVVVDGRIAAPGSDPLGGAVVHDLDGAFVMPGLQDAHGHLLRLTASTGWRFRRSRCLVTWCVARFVLQFCSDPSDNPYMGLLRGTRESPGRAVQATFEEMSRNRYPDSATRSSRITTQWSRSPGGE